MTFLLDTHAFLWFVLSPKKLPVSVFQTIQREKYVFLSAVSIAEISIKFALGKLSLPDQPARWIPKTLAKEAILTIPFETSAALALSELEPIHRDPFDRMLVCQANTLGMHLITDDEQIKRYRVTTSWISTMSKPSE